MDERRRKDRQLLLLALAIFLAGMCIRAWLYRQPFNSDDMNYFWNAERIALLGIGTDQVSLTSHISCRLAVLAPARAMILVFGYTPVAFYCTVYSIAVLSGLSVLFFARSLSTSRAAAIAVGIWAISPVMIEVDTRLLTDNLGTALSLFALGIIARAGGLGAITSEAAWARIPRSAAAIVAGLLLWGAWSARSTFGVFLVVGLLIAALGCRRWRLMAMVLLGFSIGFGGELIWFWARTGDAMTRLRILFAYPEQISAEPGMSSGRWFLAMTPVDLFLRYPKLLIGSPELVFHVLGLAGALVWIRRIKERASAAKLIALVVPYAVLTLAIVSWEPMQPLLRTKARYYTMAAPLFHLGAAEMLVLGMALLRDRSRVWRYPVGIVAAAFVLACLYVASLGSARAGDDGYLEAARAVAEHATETGRPKIVVTDGGTQRVLRMLLPVADGWTHASFGELPTEPAYGVLSWERLNKNVRFGISDQISLDLYCAVSDWPVVFRHHHNRDLTEVVLVGEDATQRTAVDVGERLPPGWHELEEPSIFLFDLHGRAAPWHRGPRPRSPLLVSGEHVDTPPEEPGPLPGGSIVRVSFAGRLTADPEQKGRGRPVIEGYLYWWNDEDELTTQTLGRARLATRAAQPVCLWTYLPSDASRFRVVFAFEAGGRPVEVHDVAVSVLEPHALDRFEQSGGAW